MKITLAYACPDRFEEKVIELPDGASLADALAQSGWNVPVDSAVGVWGKVRSREELLRDQDRVEIYRPLQADPKTARRKRAGQ